MSRKLSVLAVAAVAAALAAPKATAGETVKVHLPFEFVLAGQPLPGGDYRFEIDETARVVHVYAPSGRHLTTALCQAQPNAAREVGIVFHKHAGQRFLKAVTTGHGSEVTLPEVSAERAAEAADVARPVVGLP
ncbi:MAG: hypothetical protein U0599_30540 [Vicinamibacteria bacterium]